jgi:hypothetical protein
MIQSGIVFVSRDNAGNYAGRKSQIAANIKTSTQKHLTQRRKEAKTQMRDGNPHRAKVRGHFGLGIRKLFKDFAPLR